MFVICFPIECKHPKTRRLCLFSHCVFQALRIMNQQVRANFQAPSMVAWSHQMWHLEWVMHPLPFLFKTVARRQAVCMGKIPWDRAIVLALLHHLICALTETCTQSLCWSFLSRGLKTVGDHQWFTIWQQAQQEWCSCCLNPKFPGSNQVLQTTAIVLTQLLAYKYL